MIARPKMSQNEWKTTEIRASKVGNFSPFSCPGAYVGHGGDTYGFLSEQGFYPTVNATIAVVANEDQHGDFVKNTLACGAYKIIAEVTQGRKAAVTCAP